MSSESSMRRAKTPWSIPVPSPATLVVNVYAESSEQGYWLGVAASAFAHPVGGRLRVQLGHTPGVIGHDSVMVVQLGDDEDSCRAGRG